MAAMGTVLLGTLYPLFMDAMGLGKISVGPPYFNAVFIPLMTPVLFLAAIGPLTRWKGDDLPSLALRMKWAFAVALVTAALLPLTLDGMNLWASLGLFLSLWILFGVLAGFIERVKNAPGGVLAKLSTLRAVLGYAGRPCRARGGGDRHNRGFQL